MSRSFAFNQIYVLLDVKVTLFATGFPPYGTDSTHLSVIILKHTPTIKTCLNTKGKIEQGLKCNTYSMKTITKKLL